MIKGAPQDRETERGFINHQGDLTDDELLEAVKKRREKKKIKK